MALALILCACGGAGDVRQAPTAPAPATASTASATPLSGGTLTVDGLLARTPADGEVLLRLAVVRAHPLAPRLEPFVRAWPGWSTTLGSITQHPVADLEWIDVVGPKDATRERLATRTGTNLGDDDVDSRLQNRSDGTLRVVLRPRPHLVVAVSSDAAAAVEPALLASPLVDPPAESDEGLAVDFPHPHEMLPQIPDEARRLVVRVYARPGGAAEALAEITCDDEAAATATATTLRDRAAAVNDVMVRLLTRDLLGGLVVEARGPHVELRLPATAEQADALVTLATATLLPSGT
ncbi:MAG TPA: hypothetical protein VIY73_03145 [Polyangiaceae bacterium]